MKNWMWMTLVIITATQAQGGETKTQRSMVERIVSAHSTSLIGRPNTGLITIAPIESKIQVEMISDPCGSLKPTGGIACTAAPVTVSLFEFRLEGVRTGTCDTVLYIGSGEWEGQPVTIEVSDNREFYKNCKSIAPVPSTRGTLAITTKDGVRVVYNLHATELK